MFRFLSFTGEWLTRIGWISAFLLTSVQRFCSTLFYGRLSPELAELASLSLSCQCLSRTKLSFPNFLKRKRWHFGLRVYGPIIWLFPSTIIESGHDTRVTWIPFFAQQATGHRVRGIDFRSYLLLTVNLSACWFRHRRVGESTSPSPSL